ncbi:FAD-dependent monooxygenase [Saccharopolyspora rectivirgula]|jgi:FAD-dependent urate hydroxylase|uniref:Salicylate monooxygenase n=1 Tax=Saccharopolyspora rectivirgula TaxID=28042 RepID=A0A073AW80_9PSEU|nr:FAD-dependent monooxygenase [Saccharopolyspora rectivirgula]KEI44053.1 salicylate monooxygenase [Saccharopolyspora rectivirgula]
MRVLVIGAGVGGLAVANGLIRHGHQVQVFEHAEQLRTGGAGLTIWSNGTRALRELGVDIEPLGRVLTSLRAMTETGRFLWEADLAAVTAELGSPTVQIPRERLIAALAEPLAAGVVQFGKRCVRVTEHPDHVVAHFDDGSTATGDLVIGADGHRSAVRRGLLDKRPAKPAGWASWQGLTPSDLPVAHGNRTLNIAGRYAHCGLIPTGNGLLHWWFDMPWKEGDPIHSIAALRRLFRDYPEPVRALLASVTDDDLGFFPHVRHRIPRVWGGPRSTLIGDAAHAMPPVVAQAANQTLEDAWLLSQHLAGASGEPGALLRAYEAERRPRVSKISRTAALTIKQRSTPLQRLAKFPGWLATRSQVATLRAGSNVLQKLTRTPRVRVA